MFRTPLIKLPHRYSCSIIGTCISIDELNKIRKKAKLYPKQRLSDYDVHRLFVGIAEERCYANRRLQKILDTKYKLIIREFMAVSENDAIAELWKKHLKIGSIAGAYWALLTHPQSSEELLSKAYGEVHMLSHLKGTSIRVNREELKILHARNQFLKQQREESLKKNQDTLSQKDKVIQQHKKELAQLQQEINALKVAKSSTPLATKDYTPFVFANSAIDHKIESLEEKNQAFSEKNNQLLAENHQLRSQLSSLHNGENTPACAASCNSAEYCQQNDLKGKCILYVGGREKQCGHFKQIIKEKNGRLIHHNGKNDGIHTLKSTLLQADTIMCPLDCISHEAMGIIKQYCKKSEKKLVLMSRSSLSAFERGLSHIE